MRTCHLAKSGLSCQLRWAFLWQIFLQNVNCVAILIDVAHKTRGRGFGQLEFLLRVETTLFLSNEGRWNMAIEEVTRKLLLLTSRTIELVSRSPNLSLCLMSFLYALPLLWMCMHLDLTLFAVNLHLALFLPFVNICLSYPLCLLTRKPTFLFKST